MCPRPLPARPAYPTGQGQAERAMGPQKEALRATIQGGPRAALTRWGEPPAPVSGEKTGGDREAPNHY